MTNNILVTSVSAKVQLIESLVVACREYGLSLYATDVNNDCPALYFADDYVLLPRLSDPGYLRALISFCHEKNIGYIIPTRDQDLVYFSSRISQLLEQGIKILMSDAKTIATCTDKHAFHSACVVHGLPVLPRMTVKDLRFPCVAKEVYSSAGKGVHFLLTQEALEDLMAKLPETEFLFEPLVAFDEFTIDAFFNAAGECVQAVARQRMLVVGGESKVSQVVNNPLLVELAQRLGEHFSFFGHVTIQAFYHQGQAFLIEVNPRFGGASNLSIVAGLDSPRKLIAAVCGDTLKANEVNPVQYGMKMLRYSKDLMIRDDAEK